MDELSYAGTVAAWRLDKQRRLFKSSDRVQQLQLQIVILKAKLADMALTLNVEGRLTEEELGSICTEITQLSEQVEEERRLQETIRNEQPPPKPETVPAGIYTPNLPQRRLVCPADGKPLPGPDRFCMEHGVEGVVAT